MKFKMLIIIMILNKNICKKTYLISCKDDTLLFLIGLRHEINDFTSKKISPQIKKLELKFFQNRLLEPLWVYEVNLII